jgi:tripartite-type tricarboxylate transporter receptor subunit TctC
MRIRYPMLVCLALWCAWPVLAQTEHFPLRPIRLIVPWTAGGSGDAVLRPLAAAAAKQLGQSVIIENRPGASGTIGVAAMVRAKPDGYTLAQVPVTVFTAAHTSKLAFDPLSDLTYIIHISGYTFGLVVRADSPWKTLEDLVRYARDHPGELTYATSGPASPGQVAMEQIAAARGARLLHVPYKGVADAVTAILGGHVHAVAASSGWASQVDAGKLRLLATFSNARTKRWPRVPTVKELGYDVVVTSPYGIAGPKGLDPSVTKRLHDAFRAALQDPATLKTMDQLDQVTEYLGSADYAAYARKLYVEQGEIVKRLGLAKDKESALQ